MKSLTAFNLLDWIDTHRDKLRPPVCNQQVFEEDDFIVMVVGGPNSRKDYHLDEGPELFYQIEGRMVLQVIENGERKDITIGEGEMLLLPPGAPLKLSAPTLSSFSFSFSSSFVTLFGTSGTVSDISSS